MADLFLVLREKTERIDELEKEVAQLTQERDLAGENARALFDEVERLRAALVHDLKENDDTIERLEAEVARLTHERDLAGENARALFDEAARLRAVLEKISAKHPCGRDPTGVGVMARLELAKGGADEL